MKVEKTSPQQLEQVEQQKILFYIYTPLFSNIQQTFLLFQSRQALSYFSTFLFFQFTYGFSTFPIHTIAVLFCSFSTFLVLKDFSTCLSSPRTFPLFYFSSLQFTCLPSELVHFSTFLNVKGSRSLSYFSTSPIHTIAFLFLSFSTFLVLKDFSTFLSSPRTFPLFNFSSLQFTCLLSELFHFSTFLHFKRPR